MLDLAYEAGVMNRPWWHHVGHFLAGAAMAALGIALFLCVAAGIAWFSVVLVP